MQNILITGIGGPTPRSIAKTLKTSHPNCRIIGVDANPRALGFYIPGLVDASYVVPRVTESAYWQKIREIISHEQIKVAFVQPELEVIEWGKYFENNGAYPCPVLLPPKVLSESLVDKSVMADLLEGTEYIPKTIKVSYTTPRLDEVVDTIGFPCWIRATKGSGGFGSLKIENPDHYKSWLFINRGIEEFTVSEFLEGRHLATQMLYVDGKFIKGASLQCVDYVMADIAPSKVTGNTSFGRFLNENRILDFSVACLDFLSEKLETPLHGVFSLDLKEDQSGNMKVTEVNVRHMAYTGVMSRVGFDLAGDTLKYLSGQKEGIHNTGFYEYDADYIFLRDVDVEPVVMRENELLK